MAWDYFDGYWPRDEYNTQGLTTKERGRMIFVKFCSITGYFICLTRIIN